jgi:hypothetical protein
MGTFAHSQPHATITAKLFCFSRNVENRTVVFGSPPALGAGGPVRIRAPRPLICKSFGYTQRCSEGKRWRKKYVPLNLVSAHWANLGRYREIGDARAHRDLLDGGARHHRIDHRWRR